MPKLLVALLAAVDVGGGAAGGGLYLATRSETLEEVPRTAGGVEPLPSAAPTPHRPRL